MYVLLGTGTHVHIYKCKQCVLVPKSQKQVDKSTQVPSDSNSNFVKFQKLEVRRKKEEAAIDLNESKKRLVDVEREAKEKQIVLQGRESDINMIRSAITITINY